MAPRPLAAGCTLRAPSRSVRPSQMVQGYTGRVSALLAAVALAELCGPVPEAGTTRDPDDSAAYAAVGDEALASGDTHIAAIAYRKAVALDPANEHAVAALASLCKPEPALDDGSALL